MTTGKQEGKLQKEIKVHWASEGLYFSKTHEVLSSGKPDLRISNPLWGQIDLELKHKATGPTGIATGITPLQAIKIDEMNNYGIPAMGLVWSQFHKLWFITMEEKEDTRELADWRWLAPVVKRSPDPRSVYVAARRLLSDRGYKSAAHLIID